MKRHLYKYKLAAKIRRFLEERRGHEVAINHELVRKDGLLLTLLPSRTKWIDLTAYYLTWPGAKVVWAVYVKEAE